MPPESGSDPITTPVGAGIVAPSPPAPLEKPPTSTQIVREAGASDQKDWKRMFDSIRGEIDGRQAQWDTWKGQSDTVITQLREEIASLRGQMQTVGAEKDGYQAQLEALPQLQQTASLAEALQAENSKLKEVLRYPTLLAQTVVETTQEDGQEPQEVRSNAFLDLALSSSLQGDAYKRLLEQIESKLPQISTTAPPPARPLNMVVPGQPAPVQTTTIAELREALQEASNRGDRDEARRINEELLMLRHKT